VFLRSIRVSKRGEVLFNMMYFKFVVQIWFRDKKCLADLNVNPYLATTPMRQHKRYKSQ